MTVSLSEIEKQWRELQSILTRQTNQEVSKERLEMVLLELGFNHLEELIEYMDQKEMNLQEKVEYISEDAVELAEEDTSVNVDKIIYGQ